MGDSILTVCTFRGFNEVQSTLTCTCFVWKSDRLFCKAHDRAATVHFLLNNCIPEYYDQIEPNLKYQPLPLEIFIQKLDDNQEPIQVSAVFHKLLPEVLIKLRQPEIKKVSGGYFNWVKQHDSVNFRCILCKSTDLEKLTCSMLPCYHIFCTPCIFRFVKNADVDVHNKCPICQVANKKIFAIGTGKVTTMIKLRTVA